MYAGGPVGCLCRDRARRGDLGVLRDRGLDATGGTLFILDGGKALRKAVTDVYGDLAIIARCRVHKERNVMDHLPEAQRPWVRRKLYQAWANPNTSEAEAALKALTRQLDNVNLTETLTVTRLGVTGTLLKTVMSTNPVESMIEIVRANARNVKRWKDGDMRLRWAATGMLAAESQFRRVKSYWQLPALATALEHTVNPDTCLPSLSQPDHKIQQRSPPPKSTDKGSTSVPLGEDDLINGAEMGRV